MVKVVIIFISSCILLKNTVSFKQVSINMIRFFCNSLYFFIFVFSGIFSFADTEYSIAGFVDVSAQKEYRQVLHMKEGWLFKRDDGVEDKISLPYEFSPKQNNRFSKKIFLPEGIKGQRIVFYLDKMEFPFNLKVNGQVCGSYDEEGLSCLCDVTRAVHFGQDNLIVLEPDFQRVKSGKGKEEVVLKNASLLVNGEVRISDVNEFEGKGGVFFKTKLYHPGKKTAETEIRVHVVNGAAENKKLIVNAVLTRIGDFNPVGDEKKMSLEPGEDGAVSIELPLTKVRPWSFTNPQLYYLITSVYEDRGRDRPVVLLDARALKVGIKTVKIDEKGILLNGERVREKLLGAHATGSFPGLGEAMPDSLLRRDAVKMKEAGINVVKCMEGMLDSAFLDACDEVGLFVIASPDISDEKLLRGQVRKDRNRPSILMWDVPESGEGNSNSFSASDAIREECGGGYVVTDGVKAVGREGERSFFINADEVESAVREERCVLRQWGEMPMLVQARSYLGEKGSEGVSWGNIQSSPDKVLGMFLPLAIDGEREGFNGLMDHYRQPKTSWYAFRAGAGNLRNIHIANECSPFSPRDVVVFSNCEVLKARIGGKDFDDKKNDVFPFVYEDAANGRRGQEIRILGFDKRGVSETAVKNGRKGEVDLDLKLDHDLDSIRADGSEVLVLIASAIFKNNVNGVDSMDIDRYAAGKIRFTINGDAVFIGKNQKKELERDIVWGTAPVALRVGVEPGEVNVKAELLSKGRIVATRELRFDMEALPGLVDVGEEGEEMIAKDK